MLIPNRDGIFILHTQVQRQHQMAQQDMEATREALEQTATDALSLAREQSALQDRMRGATPEELANMRSDEAALLQGARNMADNLSAETAGDQGSNEVAAQVGRAMEAMQEALDALENDHTFLTEGNVFTDDLIETWIEWKRKEELAPLAQRPHPYEFYLYYDV